MKYTMLIVYYMSIYSLACYSANEHLDQNRLSSPEEILSSLNTVLEKLNANQQPKRYSLIKKELQNQLTTTKEDNKEYNSNNIKRNPYDNRILLPISEQRTKNVNLIRIRELKKELSILYNLINLIKNEEIKKTPQEPAEEEAQLIHELKQDIENLNKTLQDMIALVSINKVKKKT